MIFAEHALLPQGWAKGVRITVAGGHITDVQIGATAQSGDSHVSCLLPALSNLHSHAFQRAMAGMTEYRAAGRDSFWSWRDLMYRFAGRITPDQVRAIAALTFMEMQEAGFAAVGEFHYLHHGIGGARYDDLGEMSVQIFAAASQTGIGLTHLPVLYTYGGAGALELGAGQARFGNGVDQFAQLLEAVRRAAQALPKDTVVGIAPHSLRATNPADLARALPLGTAGPVHIHVAEQPREVADIAAWLGARPVEWLLQNAPVGPNWCLIHATHMTAAETSGLAATTAVAGLCPITEANLGDGPFNGAGWLANGGRFGVGSDSNVRISLTEELRMLEYSQRLRDIERNILASEGSVGQAIYTGAAMGGAQAMGRKSGQIAVGMLADLTAIDLGHHTLCALRVDQILDGLVFAAHDGVVTDLWSAGRHCVRGGRHMARDAVIAGWRRAVAELTAAL